ASGREVGRLERVDAARGGQGVGEQAGDGHRADAAVAGAITPVPGGVGPMTIACLLANTLTAASRIHALEPPDLTP
ncbi:MAG: hypothetical protein R6V44_04380, partial [Paracoccaceae bacterium]